ncbi:MAG: cytidine deaminase [Bacteroidales bacterium]|nr:cytidine deaminase [Bacteroidales bacterium]
MKKDSITIAYDVYEAHDAEFPAPYAELIEEAKAASRASYAPYSQFHVGAALRLANGVIMRGSNQENAVFPVTCCAERTALYAAGAQYPDVAVTDIAIAVWREKDGLFLSTPASPCGMCRQHLVETEQRHGQPIRVILYGTAETYVLASARHLLPLTFIGEEL